MINIYLMPTNFFFSFAQWFIIFYLSSLPNNSEEYERCFGRKRGTWLGLNWEHNGVRSIKLFELDFAYGPLLIGILINPLWFLVTKKKTLFDFLTQKKPLWFTLNGTVIFDCDQWPRHKLFKGKWSMDPLLHLWHTSPHWDEVWEG